jgi:hypothetical protein
MVNLSLSVTITVFEGQSYGTYNNRFLFDFLVFKGAFLFMFSFFLNGLLQNFCIIMFLCVSKYVSAAAPGFGA